MRVFPKELELWRQFRESQMNEMIITKNGRCLFPLLKFEVELDDSEKACQTFPVSVALTIERADSLKWKYKSGKWAPIASNSCAVPPSIDAQLYEPEEYAPSANLHVLSREGLSFGKVKLSNRKDQLPHTFKHPDNLFALSSFAHYVPVVYLLDRTRLHQVYPDDSNSSIIGVIQSIGHYRLSQDGILKRFEQWECDFIAVTHYQNVNITDLKKHNNPHAKGFVLNEDSSFATPHRQSQSQRRVYPIADIPPDVLMASAALQKMSASPLSPSLELEERFSPLSPIRRPRGRPRYTAAFASDLSSQEKESGDKVKLDQQAVKRDMLI